MHFLILVLFFIFERSDQCMRTVDHQGTTIAPTRPKTTTAFAHKTTTKIPSTSTKPAQTTKYINCTSTSSTSTTTTTTSSTTTTEMPAPCGDATWILSAASTQTPLCFKALNLAKPAGGSWLLGRQMCTQQLGAKIAPMRNDPERLAIKAATAKLDKTGWPTHDFTGIFFGFMDIGTSKATPAEYQWAYDNTMIIPTDYMHWSPGEPKRELEGSNYDKCVSARVYGEFLWNDIQCGLSVSSNLMVAVVCAKEPM